MIPIQYVLIGAIGISTVLYFARLRSPKRDRLVVLFVSLVACSCVLMPDWTTKAAQIVGVGRGADLTLYVSIVALGLMNLVLLSRLREIRLQITELTRRHAIDRAVPPRTQVRQQ